MIIIDNNNERDAGVDEQIFACINPDDPKSFFLFAGAGSGKTRTLVEVLRKFRIEYGRRFRLRKQQIAVITYTNAARDEIIHRLEYDQIFEVTTIHSFSWDLIRHLTYDIRLWLETNLESELEELHQAQAKSRDLNNKTSLERARKIDSKTKRRQQLAGIRKFVYNPNGDNLTKDSLNHAEVIAMTADFIGKQDLMQDIVCSRFPIILVDESQDTKKELLDALFVLQAQKSNCFCLGLFGDTMQRIYSDGKEQLEQSLPVDWERPSKVMNHRSNKRIIGLVNNIRKGVDDQQQTPRYEKADGIVRVFIAERGVDKFQTEVQAAEKMAEITGDVSWSLHLEKVKILILEHHMAATRMGFFNFFEPLYAQNKLKTGLLDGSLPGISFFTKMVLPLMKAHRSGDHFSVAKIVKKYCPIILRKQLAGSEDQSANIENANLAYQSFVKLWPGSNEPSLLDVVLELAKTGLFPIPEAFYPLTGGGPNIESEDSVSEDEDDNPDDVLRAWELALSNPFSQIEQYDSYITEKSRFGTHQGVKGLEFERVMVIVDDEEAKGFMFSYDKLFGARELSVGDVKNKNEGKETGIDRTRRLFYVACSRAKESLAIMAYTDNPSQVRNNLLEYGWFSKDEIEMMTN